MSFDGVPQLLILGHVTRDDLPGGGTRLGGAAAYGALAAARLGIRTALVTAAQPDEPVVAALLVALKDEPRLRIHVVPDGATTTFALSYEAGTRHLFLRRRARSLVPADVPEEFRRAPVAYVGPVAGECDRALIASLGARHVGVGLQGWLRTFERDGRVVPALADEALRPPACACAIVSEADHPEVEAIAARFAVAGATVAITRGSRGATLLDGATRAEVSAAPAREVEPTGAGDVFGVVLTWWLSQGASVREAAAAAAEAAARVVEGPGLGRLARVD